MLDGRVLADIQREGGLSHARPGGQDDQLTGLESARDVVEIDEARRHSRHRMAARIGPLGDPIHRPGDHVLQFERVALDLVLGDGEDLALGRLQQILGGELVGISIANDLGGAVDQLTADRSLADDRGIILGVGRVRDGVDDLPECLVATDLLELIATGQFVGQGDGIDAFTLIIEVANGLVDRLMGVSVKIIDREHRDDFVQDVIVQQDASEYPLLGFQVLRRQAIADRGGIRLGRAAHAIAVTVIVSLAVARTVICRRHRPSSSVAIAWFVRSTHHGGDPLTSRLDATA